MKESEDKNEPFSQEPNIPLNSEEIEANKKEKKKIFLILSVPVIFILGLIVILLIITIKGSKKEKKYIRKATK